MRSSGECWSMAEQFATKAGSPDWSSRERALLTDLSSAWAALAWATELLERHGVAPGELEAEADS